MNNIIGSLQKQKKGYTAFILNSFPPKDGFNINPKVLKKNDEATRLIGKLDGITKLLPDADFFLLMYLRKDATSSSQIEGTMATMIDAIEAEIHINTDTPDDVDDILHYINALNYGIKRVGKEKFPISLRFIREIHEKLMHKARASHFCDPGEFRKTQNWIGGTRPDNALFVPPPVPKMKEALADLENFMHCDNPIPTIIESGLIHAQFETIHPFLDGNGRTGRMLITFYLWKKGFLEKPVLFLSSYFKKHQKIYYQKLSTYHDGDINGWIEFYLDGVIEIAQEAIDIVDQITILREKNIIKIQKLSKRASESASIVMRELYAQPIVDTNIVQKWTGFNRAGAQNVINRFIDMGILSQKDKDVTYDRHYIFKEYITIFSSK